MKAKFTIAGPPRTKKTHQQLVQMGPRKIPMILPSRQYRAWFKEAMKQAPIARTLCRDAGIDTPIAVPVRVAAVFYRDRNIGDLCGFQQALGDYLQAPRQRNGKTTRHGAGVIDDDKLIASWDGTRLDKDAANPRVEVTIELLGAQQGALGIEEE